MSERGAVRVLVVCTGNICRSPYAALRLQQALAALAPGTVEVTSAGVEAMVGAEMDPAMAELLAERGGDPAGHLARQLDRDQLDEADLVLAATRDHRRDIVRMLPRISRLAFTIPEFTRLLEDAAAAGMLEPGALETRMRETRMLDADAGEQDRPAPAARLCAAIAAAADRRGFAETPDDPAADDVIDPYRRSAATYARAAELLDAAVERIAAAFARALPAPGEAR